ncbi:Zn-dependent exopeptidase [Cylindrobasidium torrendii FP15055 ss-10]|uniref:Zn-dependent exopeptidase n=1 Tax=Cylindrobasidium torrendii FP15055 ss-10 TaxID=1314674 RepID=A0A0D7BM05_9AGAR|nr:Zn-dependent exopeptidase [Cylindrobasidium torrendii FP15055 ss-10]
MADSLPSPVDPSLSRELISNESEPRLTHTLHELHSSVLSLAASEQYIFSGSQNQDISVWSKKSFKLKHTLCGHTGSVLALEYAADREWLFSSSGDSTVRVWSTTSLKPLYVIDPYLETGAGDLFSLAWSKRLQTLYIGCQNTSLQWLDFKKAQGTGPLSRADSTIKKAHKFFDSYPVYERKAADLLHSNTPGSGTGTPVTGSEVPRLAIPVDNMLESAHYGYIYSLSITEDCDSGVVHLSSGSGDESIKSWTCTPDGPVFDHECECHFGAVLAIVSQGNTVYAACQDGVVKIFDIETKSIVRTIIVQEGVDILSLSKLKTDLYVCLANGKILRYSESFDCTASWEAHDGIVLSSVITASGPGYILLTGGNDDNIKMWEVRLPRTRTRSLNVQNFNDSLKPLTRAASEEETLPEFQDDTLEYALSKFISFPSVSSSPSNREDCRQAAIWLKKCLGQLGANASLLATGDSVSPLVLGTFTGVQSPQASRKPRILFYGHYDVMAAAPENWDSDPFVLTGRNGYFYGRGVTDDKGPVLATAFGAANLLLKRQLGVDVVFLIEGEEETGSHGFADAVKAHKDAIGQIDAILVSNSNWITDSHPCLTYGLRGVVHCDLEITGGFPDLHSGVDGGGIAEPMEDMQVEQIQLLSTLSDRKKRVQIPAFYDSVRPLLPDEEEISQRLSEVTGKDKSWLSARWREPSLTVHSIEGSGANSTVIPGTVKASVSVRIVPDQDLETISHALQTHLTDSFKALESPNRFTVETVKATDWWLGQLDGKWFQALAHAIQEEWGFDPLYIREGGSIPSIPYLEKELGCHALHLPMGQSTDRAHLPNERISLANLKRGKSVIERFLLNVAKSDISLS